MKDKTDNNKIREAEQFYASFLKYVKTVFMCIDALDINSIAKEIITLRSEIAHNSQFLLYAMNSIEPAKDENYLAAHAVRTSVIAIIIGKQLKIAPHRLAELGIAALLHDIGMFMLPTGTYFNDFILDTQEREIIYSHPMQGFNVLKSSNCSPVICSAVLEHHERENGLGYPRKLKGEHISLYGKIIAAACSYEALCAKRTYKKAMNQHSGIVELLKNKENKYDANVVRALAAALSIYPIGMHVLLSNGEHGRVFALNQENHHYPVVKIGEETVINTSCNGVSITRPVTQEEIDPKRQSWCSAEEYIEKHRAALLAGAPCLCN